MKPEEQLDKILKYLNNDDTEDRRELFNEIKDKVGFNITEKDLELALNKLVDDKYVRRTDLINRERVPVGGYCYDITYHGRLFSSRGGYQSESKKLIAQKRWITVKTTAIAVNTVIVTIIAIVGTLIAWETLLQENKNDEQIKKVEQRITPLESDVQLDSLRLRIERLENRK